MVAKKVQVVAGSTGNDTNIRPRTTLRHPPKHDPCLCQFKSIRHFPDLPLGGGASRTHTLTHARTQPASTHSYTHTPYFHRSLIQLHKEHLMFDAARIKSIFLMFGPSLCFSPAPLLHIRGFLYQIKNEALIRGGVERAA